MRDKDEYLILAEQCRRRCDSAASIEDKIEWTRIADLSARVARQHDDLYRRRVGICSIPRDETTRIGLRARAMVGTFPRRYD